MNNRLKNIQASAVTGLIARIVGVLSSVLVVSISVDYLGADGYGYWVAATSFLAVLSFADGGAGNSVVNKVASASRSKISELPVIISSAYIVMLAFAFVGGCIFSVANSYFDWVDVLGGRGKVPERDAQLIVVVAASSFFIGIITSLVYKIQRGFQNGARENFWLGLTAVLLGLSAYAARYFDVGLIWYAVLVSYVPIFVQVIATLHFVWAEKNINFRGSTIFSLEISLELVRKGGVFLVLQVASAVQGQMDNVIISKMIGPSAVAQYSVCMKLFLMPMMFYGVVLNPLWPAYREALAANDFNWIKNSFGGVLKISFAIGVFFALVMILASGFIIDIWVGSEYVPSYILRVGCGIWLFLNIIGGALAVFLNGMEILRPQLIIAAVTTMFNLIITISLVPLIGVSGAVWGSVLAYAVFALLPSFLLVRKSINSFAFNHG